MLVCVREGSATNRPEMALTVKNIKFGTIPGFILSFLIAVSFITLSFWHQRSTVITLYSIGALESFFDL